MKYDPIMCMMVDDTIKSNDKKTVDASFNVVYKSNTGTMQALVMAESEKEAEQKVRSREGSKFVSLIGVKKMSDSNTLDKAIKMCDERIKLIKTLKKKNGYAIHIVEGGYGERIVLTFPNESYANPHMWLGSNNSSNIQKAKELLDEFSK